MKNKIFFRFEINSKIGTGHAIRCLRIANFLFKKKFKIYIITSKDSFKILKNFKIKNFQLIDISNTKDNIKDARYTVNSIRKFSLNEHVYIFKDNYNLNLKWDNLVKKKYKKLIILDDFLNKKHNCKIYINFNPYKIKDIKFKNKKTRYLVGLKYFPYDQFIKRKHQKKLCLIYFGGSDKHNLTLKIIKLIINLKINNINFLVLIGKFNKKKSTIKKITKNNKKFQIVERFTDMHPIYKKVSHIIGTGGTTLWETIINDIYPLIIPSHSNHLKPCRFLSKNSKILLINNLKTKKIILKNKIQTYLKNRPKNVKNNKIIDKNGLERIYKVINETK